MDLYNPLYVARPTVEPELFASPAAADLQRGHAEAATDVAGSRARDRGLGGPGAGGGFGAGRPMPKTAPAGGEGGRRPDASRGGGPRPRSSGSFAAEVGRAAAADRMDLGAQRAERRDGRRRWATTSST